MADKISVEGIDEDGQHDREPTPNTVSCPGDAEGDSSLTIMADSSPPIEDSVIHSDQEPGSKLANVMETVDRTRPLESSPSSPPFPCPLPNKLAKHWALLITGVVATAIATRFAIHDPSAYTLGALAAEFLSRPIIYFIILGIIALCISAIRENVRMYWFPILAWLFLVAGVFDIIVRGYNEFVLRPKVDRELQELVRSGKDGSQVVTTAPDDGLTEWINTVKVSDPTDEKITERRANSSRSARLYPPAIDGFASGYRAIEQFDANKDNKISGEELDVCPGLKAAVDQINPRGRGEITSDMIANRIYAWQKSRLGRMALSCRVTYKGRPLGGAEVSAKES